MKYNKKIAVCAFSLLMGMAMAVPSVSYAEAEHQSEWFTDENGRIFYYNAEGNYVTGEQEIDGGKYLFSANGVLKTGWRTVDGQRRYYDTETGRQATGWIYYCGKKYYIDTEDGKVTGFFREDDETAYLLGEKGNAITDEGLTEVNGNTYYVNENGNAETGIVAVGEDTYFFDYDGTMSSGFIEENGNIYYFSEDGTMTTGFLNKNDKTYCFGNDGAMLKGAWKVNGNNYFFSEIDGQMIISDWATATDGNTYYSNADGSLLSGWWNIGENTYYFNENCTLARGITAVSGYGTYFFDETNGAMLKGWQTAGGNSYYFSMENGKMFSGLQTIDGNKYFFNEDGVLSRNVMITDGTGKYYIGNDGAMVYGWQAINGNYYYFSTTDGKMVYGWQIIDNNEYFFDDNGIMLTNTTIDGKVIGADGKVQPISAVQKRANDIIAQIGTSTESIYNFVTIHNKYQLMEQTKTLSQINAIGWSYFANYALDNRFIVCYYYAALTDLLLKQAGWQSRIVYGTGYGTGDHYWNEFYADGTWYSIDTCNGYYMTSFSFLQTKNYTFYQYVYPTYN